MWQVSLARLDVIVLGSLQISRTNVGVPQRGHQRGSKVTGTQTTLGEQGTFWGYKREQEWEVTYRAGEAYRLLSREEKLPHPSLTQLLLCVNTGEEQESGHVVHCHLELFLSSEIMVMHAITAALVSRRQSPCYAQRTEFTIPCQTITNSKTLPRYSWTSWSPSNPIVWAYLFFS